MRILRWINEGNRLERIWLLAQIEFKLMYYGNKLGLIWALINPVSQIFVYYIMFEVMFSSGIDNFAVYVFSGLFVWLFFVTLTSRSIGILKSKRSLYEHTDMNKIEIYFAQVVSSSIGLGFNFGVFLITAFISGIWPSLYYFLFIILYINLIILGLGCSLILSNLFLLFKDVNQIWGIIVRFGFFLSPILFSGDLFAKKVPILLYLNPISGIINNSRNVLLYSKMPDWNMVLFDYAYAIIILLIGIQLLNKISVRASELA